VEASGEREEKVGEAASGCRDEGCSKRVFWSNDLRPISRSLDCFTSYFSKTVCDTAKVTIDY